MENKIYNQCREEAYQIIKSSMVHSLEELAQLTAELYAQKLLNMAAKVFLPTVASGEVKYWQKDYYQNKDYYYSTKEVHDYFVEENKGGGDE